MKKIIFFQFKSFLTIFAFIFCCATVAFSQGCPPLPNPAVEFCEDAKDRSAIISPLSEHFPDCKLFVKYKAQLCVDINANVTIKIFDMEIIPEESSLGCEELLMRLANGSIEGQQFLREFNVSIGRQLQDIEANAQIFSGSPEIFDCDNPTAQKVVNADYYQSSCVSFLNATIIVGKVKRPFSRQLPCESSACCGFRRIYCFDTETNKLKFSEEYIPLKSKLCGGEKPFINPKLAKLLIDITQGPCIALCGGLKKMESGDVQQFKLAIVDKTVTLKVYPNPSHDYINIFFDKEVGGRFEIFTLEGKLLQSVNTETGSSYFDVSSFVTGTYVLKFTSLNGEIMSEKISIN